MWVSKKQAIDVNYNAEELWFVGVYGQPVAKSIRDKEVGGDFKMFQAFEQDLPSRENRLDAARPFPQPSLSHTRSKPSNND
jgi:hypothetical protein